MFRRKMYERRDRELPACYLYRLVSVYWNDCTASSC